MMSRQLNVIILSHSSILRITSHIQLASYQSKDFGAIYNDVVIIEHIFITYIIAELHDQATY